MKACFAGLIQHLNPGLRDEILSFCILCKDLKTNEEVYRKIQAAIRDCGELLTLVKKLKLRCFGLKVFWFYSKDDPTWHSEKEEEKKRWIDNIKEMTAMDFTSSSSTAENRTRWKGIVAKSSVEP